MNTVLHRADSRGKVSHEWLDSRPTFSFGPYYDPMRVHFGALRVLNDDTLEGGKGFDSHLHDNMEIISIPLSGDLEHKDSLNNASVIRQNDIQIMSAGTGVSHAEFNHNAEKKVNFLQIWILPKQRNTKPNYEQGRFDPANRINKLQLMVSPDQEGESLRINQDAWAYRGDLRKGFHTEYVFNNKGCGLYAFVIEGKINIHGQALNRRDGFGVWDIETISIEATGDADLLLMEVPMLN